MIRGRRKVGASGQAAVESALATPISLFVVFGILQMSLVQQARFFTDYAAMRGARAASVARGECEPILKAEIAALVPTLGRADNSTTWNKVFDDYKKNKRYGLPVVYTTWEVVNRHFPFDDPFATSPEKVHLKLSYFFEMKIPFVNYFIARFFLAQRRVETWANMVDPTMPANQTTSEPMAAGSSSSPETVIAKVYYGKSKYVIPIYASWSMRMFSQVKATRGSCQ